MDNARAVIGRYFDGFNAGDTEAMLACLATDVSTMSTRVRARRQGQICGVLRPYDPVLPRDLDRLGGHGVTEDGTRAAAEYSGERDLSGDR